MNRLAADVYEGLDVSVEEVAHFENHHIGFCGVDMARVSQFLLTQLAAISKHRTYNSFSITDVIQELEGVGRGCKQRADTFKHSPLKGFYKAHFFDARFLSRNLINYWGLEFEKSPKLASLMMRIDDEEKRQPTKLGWQGRLAHEMTIAAYDEISKRNKQTGEWIIFARHDDLNYFLCLSQHTKTKEEDQSIYDFLKLLCEDEFPFLMPAV